MRRWYRAKRLTRQIDVQRVERSTGLIHTRRSTIRKRVFMHNRGFAVVNNGPAFASHLARYLSTLGDVGSPSRRRHRPTGSGGGNLGGAPAGPRPNGGSQATRPRIWAV